MAVSNISINYMVIKPRNVLNFNYGTQCWNGASDAIVNKLL